MSWRVVGYYQGAAPAKPEGVVRVICLADTHDRDLPSFPVPDGDVLVHAGDFTMSGLTSKVASFAAWFHAQKHPHKVVIAGNHDITFDHQYYTSRGRKRFHSKPQNDAEAKSLLRDAPGIHYLEDSGVTVCGLNIWGSPYSPEFCDWAFNKERGAEIAEVWAKIPQHTDILITHGPPYMEGDRCAGSNFNAGCEDLLAKIKEIKPALNVFGHIHEGYGVTQKYGVTFVNASNVDFHYALRNPPIVVDMAKT